MVGEQGLPFVFYAVFTTAVLAQGSQGTVQYLLIEMFQEYAFKYWYLMFIFYGKIDESFISTSTQESGEGRTRKGKKRNHVQGHCAQDVLKLLKDIAATVNSPEETGAYFY